MSNVTLEIGGRHFTVACGDGEERHIEKLGQRISEKIASIPGLSGQSESRTLLYAALLLADENYEFETRSAPATEVLPDIAEPLERLAERLEAVATGLESGAAAH